MVLVPCCCCTGLLVIKLSRFLLQQPTGHGRNGTGALLALFVLARLVRVSGLCRTIRYVLHFTDTNRASTCF